MIEKFLLNDVTDEEKFSEDSYISEIHFFMNDDEFEKFVEKIESCLPHFSEIQIKENILKIKNEIRNLNFSD